MPCLDCGNSLFDTWVNKGLIDDPTFHTCDVCGKSPICLDCSVKCIISRNYEESRPSHRCRSCIASDVESGTIRTNMPEIGKCNVCRDGIWKLSKCDICEEGTFCASHVNNISVMRRRVVEAIILTSSNKPIQNICQPCNRKKSKHHSRQMIINNRSNQVADWLAVNNDFVESEREKYIKKAEAKWKYKRIKMAIAHKK